MIDDDSWLFRAFASTRILVQLMFFKLSKVKKAHNYFPIDFPDKCNYVCWKKANGFVFFSNNLLLPCSLNVCQNLLWSLSLKLFSSK